MPVQLTIIGLGQIGASIGLCLAAQGETIRRMGHDKSIETARSAESSGAVDQIQINLPASVANAEVVVLAVPLDQVAETLGYIAQDLKPDCVILDTAPVKQALLEEIKTILPDHCHYIGFVPAFSPRYLLSSDAGLSGAQPDLFKKGLFAIIPAPGAPSAAIQLATDLSGMLGAEHLFIDAAELDSQMAALHLLPQVIASVLLNITVDMPGWREGRKLASRPYSWATHNAATLESPAALAQAMLQNQQNMLRVLDAFSDRLAYLHNLIKNDQQEKLTKAIQSAVTQQDEWWKERTAGEWPADETKTEVEMPSSFSWFSSLFGIRPRPKKK